ncbi:hypothetical protein QWA68_000652 [Fusarium oxysporum]|nr:hypothetical protein QWA68_000652 [Fusarium oxysporum]
MVEWVVQFTKETKSGEKKAMKLRTEFLVVTAGPLTNPKLPRIPGASNFKGTRFHTARWEYRTNGRSPEDATFDKLRHKRVGSANSGAWTKFTSYAALVSGPAIASLTSETLPDYVDRLREIDLPRQDRIRKRPNVTFVDTLGRGVDAITESGLACNGKEYPIDILIHGTGYEHLTAGGLSLRASMQIYGHGGQEMESKWSTKLATLYELMTHNYPNLFLSGVYQMGATGNYAHMVDVMASNAAKVIKTARQKLESQRPGSGEKLGLKRC